MGKAGFAPAGLTAEGALSGQHCLRFAVWSPRLIGLLFRAFCISCGAVLRVSFAFCSFALGVRYFFLFLSSRQLDGWTRIGALKPRGEFHFRRQLPKRSCPIPPPLGPSSLSVKRSCRIVTEVPLLCPILSSLFSLPPPALSSPSLPGHWQARRPCLPCASSHFSHRQQAGDPAGERTVD